MANATEEPETWGRVLIAGGTNWATNGRKDRPATRDTDLLEPHIIRSLCNVRVQKIITGPTANYAVVIDTRGVARIFGRSPALGLAVNTVGVISEHAPLRVTPWSLGAPKGTKFVGGAAGRSHLLLVDSEGSVWTCGNNVVGQCGLPTCFEIEDFTRVTGGWPKGTKIVQVSAGNTFSLFLTEGGEIYAAGSSESGQLGNGKTGERLLKGGKIGYDVEVPPKLVQGLAGKKITQIASGNQHSLAMDEDGYVWAWGFAGYSRLGLQDQKDRLVPTLVPTFAGGNEATRASMILCGPTNSVVIDRLKMYHMAGKFKLTGDGSTGQPYTSFKLIQEVTSCKVIRASCGGCTHFLTTTGSDGSVMTVGFGQGALYGELALGPDAGKSATKPQEVEPLRGVDVIDIAAGAFFTLFLARPNDTMSNLYRFPQSVPSEPACLVCHRDDELGLLLECEKCDQPYHTKCLDPPLPSVPEGEWFCPECMQEAADEEKEDDEVLIPSRRDTSVVDSVKGQAKSDRARTKSSTPRTKRLHSEDAGSDRGAKKKR